MISSVSLFLDRGRARLGRITMYRLVLGSLSVLSLLSIVLSLVGEIAPSTMEILATLLVLLVVVVTVDRVAQAICSAPARTGSSLITALILLFVLRPTLEPMWLAGIALAGAAAAASKYLLAWRGRHLFNPAAVGATVVTVVATLAPGSGILPSAWWVGSPALAAPVLLLGLVVLLRTDKVRITGVFLLVAVVVYTVRTIVQSLSFGITPDLGMTLTYALFSSPFLFLGAFMLTEPLTLPPRRWQQVVVAVTVGVLSGWAPLVGSLSLGAERAVLIGNLVAFLLCRRAGIRVRLERTGRPTPSTRELVLTARGLTSFSPGQYLELQVPHHRPDARGTRREFSIVSAPEDLPTVRIAYRDDARPQSSFKRTIATLGTDARVAVTGVWGDFVLPRDADAPLLLVAAGIGVTPFVSQLRHLRLIGQQRDIVLVHIAHRAEDLAYRDEIARTGIRVHLITRDDPQDLPDRWSWSGGRRLTADDLAALVPDLGRRHAYISGPTGLIADLKPALGQARSLTTDAFAGY